MLLCIYRNNVYIKFPKCLSLFFLTFVEYVKHFYCNTPQVPLWKEQDDEKNRKGLPQEEENIFQQKYELFELL